MQTNTSFNIHGAHKSAWPKSNKSMNVKSNVLRAYKENPFKITEKDNKPLDPEITEFIMQLRARKFIKTINSCAGHSKEERNLPDNMHPYLSFLVNETGWDIFWNNLLPKLCTKISLLVYCPEYNKGESCIIVRAEAYEDKQVFWQEVKSLFLSHFNIRNIP